MTYQLIVENDLNEDYLILILSSFFDVQFSNCNQEEFTYPNINYYIYPDDSFKQKINISVDSEKTEMELAFYICHLCKTRVIIMDLYLFSYGMLMFSPNGAIVSVFDLDDGFNFYPSFLSDYM